MNIPGHCYYQKVLFSFVTWFNLVSFSGFTQQTPALKIEIAGSNIQIKKKDIDSPILKRNILDDVFITTQRKAQEDLHIPHSTQSVSNLFLDQYQPRTTPEALAGVNGVFVQKTNHGGGSPFIRGLTGNQTLILIDGIRLNNSTYRYGPNQYLNTIDANNISKIEIAKGTGSVQYGSDAIGGVLQVFTKEPQFSGGKSNWSGKIKGKYMTGDMERTIRGEVEHSSKKSATSLGVTYRKFGDLIGGDTTGRQSPSGYNEVAFDAKTKLLLHPQAELTLDHQYLRQQHVPVYHKVRLENFSLNEIDPQQRMLNYAKLNLENGCKWIHKIEMIASWQQNIEGRNSIKNGSTTLRKERDRINTIGLTTDVTSHISGGWTANSGVDWYHDKVNSTRMDVNKQTAAVLNLRGLYPDNSKYHNYSLYSLHHFEWNNWLIESGVRFNSILIRINDTSLGKVKLNPSAFVYNSSILYKLSPHQSIYASYNTGFRAPNIDDMGTLGIVDFRYELPTANLAPEKSGNFEAGYKFKTSKWAAAVSVFYMHLQNLITRVKSEGEHVNGYQVYRKINIGEGYIKGFETEAECKILPGWQLKAGVASTYGQSLTDNEPLRRIPPLNGRVKSTYSKIYPHSSKTQNAFISAELLFASKQDRLAPGDRDDNRISKGGTPGWTVFNMYASCHFYNLQLSIGLQNIGNIDYRTHGSGINGVGRSGWVSLTVPLGGN